MPSSTIATDEPQDDEPLRVGIDASNIFSGGGVVHLKSILSELSQSSSTKCRVTVWARDTVLARLPEHDLIEKKAPFWIGLPFGLQFIWQLFFQWIDIRRYKCDVLFSPGGYLPFFCKCPRVSLSQNLLPFSPDEALLFGRTSLMRLKFFLLRQMLRSSFKKAEGLIFLTKYAQDTISPWLGGKCGKVAIIPHGIDPDFFRSQAESGEPSRFSMSRPMRLLYVSPVFPYKHQMEVLQAVDILHKRGFHLCVTFVGAPNGAYGRKFALKMESRVGDHRFSYLGHVNHEEIPQMYHQHDGCVFASSCENLPNILLEAMASRMPIVCSNKGPMYEVLGECGIYFDPYSVSSLVAAIEDVYTNFTCHAQLSVRAQLRAKAYSWTRVSEDTFTFLKTVHDDFSNRRHQTHV